MSCDKCEMKISCPVEYGIACPKLEYQEPLIADNLDHSSSEVIYCAFVVISPIVVVGILLLCRWIGIIN